MKFSDYWAFKVVTVPLLITVAVLLPAVFVMIALNCVLDIHYPGHHVGYGEAYAITYLAGFIGVRPSVTRENNKVKTTND